MVTSLSGPTDGVASRTDASVPVTPFYSDNSNGHPRQQQYQQQYPQQQYQQPQPLPWHHHQQQAPLLFSQPPAPDAQALPHSQSQPALMTFSATTGRNHGGGGHAHFAAPGGHGPWNGNQRTRSRAQNNSATNNSNINASSRPFMPGQLQPQQQSQQQQQQQTFRQAPTRQQQKGGRGNNNKGRGVGNNNAVHPYNDPQKFPPLAEWQLQQQNQHQDQQQQLLLQQQGQGLFVDGMYGGQYS